MSEYIKVSAKGQITLPSYLRKKINVRPGSYIQFTEENGAFKIVPVNMGIEKLKGSVQVSEIQDFKKVRDKAMEEMVNEKHKSN